MNPKYYKSSDRFKRVPQVPQYQKNTPVFFYFSTIFYNSSSGESAKRLGIIRSFDDVAFEYQVYDVATSAVYNIDEFDVFPVFPKRNQF